MRAGPIARPLLTVGLSAGLLAATSHARLSARQGPAAQPPGPMSSSVRMISPVALASWITERGPDGSDLLRALVILRGQPGWFLEPGESGSGVQSWNDAPGHHRQVIVQGGRRFEIEFEAFGRTLRIGTIGTVTVNLGDRNVVLVDAVDAAAPGGRGPSVDVADFRVDQLLTLGPRMPGSSAQLGPMLRDSEAILRFLRCDSTPPGARGRGLLERLCRETIGQVDPLPPEPSPDPAVSPVVDTGPARTLAEAQARWAARKPAAYEFTLALRCFCGVTDTLVAIRVRDGAPTYLTRLDEVRAYARYDTIDKVFEALREMAARRPVLLDVQYDAALGYPRVLDFDWRTNLMDDELRLTITDFKPLTAPDPAPRPRS